MGREVRMVPPDWQHPREPSRHRAGEFHYRPMLDTSHAEAVRQWEEEELPDWLEGERRWREEGKIKCPDGEVRTIAEVVASERAEGRDVEDEPGYTWWGGDRPERPSPDDYMPDWPDHQRTHFMMYENTSEGTPISPAFATAEQLARWLAATGASAFADRTATYEQWLSAIHQGGATSAVITVGGPNHGQTISGVEALA